MKITSLPCSSYYDPFFFIAADAFYGIEQSKVVRQYHSIIQLTYQRTWLSNIRHVRVRIFTYVPSLMYDHIRCTLLPRLH